MPTRRVVIEEDEYKPLSYFEALDWVATEDGDWVATDGDWDDDNDGDECRPPRTPRFHEEEAKEAGIVEEVYGHDGWHVESSDESDDWVAGGERKIGDDAAGRWLKQNDPEYKRNKVEAAIIGAAKTYDLTLDDVRRAFAGGPLTKNRSALRESVRMALFWVWEHEDRREMARVIGCGHMSLYRLFVTRAEDN